ncbi:hypothetical protein [Nocardioides litoris]|uniref:hypothetical protein n=1 Tax=Nocardioides litoris TaxID=1926648 RepID=UPI00111D2B41|nr:hypothetical protein [Nocardioides litoris]
MTRPTRGPQVGRPRAVLLVALALAAVVDLGAFVGVQAGGPSQGPEPQPSGAAGPGPEEVAAEVVRAVADADCADLAPLLDPAADLPYAVTSCLDGTAQPQPVDDVVAAPAEVDGDRATVRVELATGGTTSALGATLRRADGAWRLDGLAPLG